MFLRSKSTSWLFKSLACLKIRDSCMVRLYIGLYIVFNSKYSLTTYLEFFYAYIGKIYYIS